MSEHFRQRRISELILRYVPAELDKRRWGVRDRSTGQLLERAEYDDEALARAKCRMQAAADIEALYLPSEATALTRIVAIIGEQSDPQWSARMIFDFFQGAKS